MATPRPVDRARRDASSGVESRLEELLTRALREQRAVRPLRTGFGHPQEFDGSGFPIPQRVPALAERVRRLLAG